MLHTKNLKWFTLVELIVVITILAILGTFWFMAFSGYQKDARDGKRITNVSTIAQWFDINMAAGRLINTSETSTGYNIVITGSTFTMTGYYWAINNTLLNSLKVYSKDITTTTDYPYSYSYFPTERKYQVSSFLEDSSNLPTAMNFIDQAYAETSTGYVFVKGNFSATGGINSLIPDTTVWTNAPITNGLKTIPGSSTVVPGTSASAPPPPMVCASWYESDWVNCVNYTKLLIHSNEMYGWASILDSSPNNQTITAFSGAHHEANSPLGGSSVSFDGTGDYLSLADSEDWNFGTGDFTIDFWVNFDITRENAWIGSSQDSNNGFYMYFNTTQWVVFNAIIGIDTYLFPTSLKQWNITGWQSNKWYNVAITRSWNTWTIYRDGVSIATATNTATFPNLTSPLMIGRAPGVTDFKGFLDEFRVSKWIARWTSNFTPSTTRYTADSYTKLLIHSNTTDWSTVFTDSETTPKTITGYGDIKHKIIPAKFGNSSLNFDGVDDYLTIPNNTDWSFGSGDFTVDTWVLFNDVTGYKYIIFKGDQSSWSTVGIDIHIQNSSYLETRLYFTDSTWQYLATSSLPTTLTWHHIALVRKNNIVSLYLDGTLVQSADIGTKIMQSNSYPLYIWTRTDWYKLNGFIDELRISKWIARWTSNFTPPAAPY